ncbi:AAA family ATPase [candidate division WOR-3 bacterium]|uniref:AAA family ATPase n=1 Tax=candidate division WOR-3 bacterium TaxID=2052148 RepID=A0A9D5K8D7_UNCW3|nr:AAA family ATPase [candidate division WOR-3 bacterium]MBD3364040.1 AAA family ATPase [candidate division WOR-3 bacterium]
MDSEKLLQAMNNPDFYPHRVKKVRMEQTHTAWVFLTGTRAYKVKKPVNFGFLDFSTLKKRKEFCTREVELNRELSDLYIGVEPLSKDDKGNLRLGGTEEDAIEYTVVMREIPQEDMMSVKMEEGKVYYETINELAQNIARFHKQAKTSGEITEQGSLESVRFNWEENFTQTENVRDVTIGKDDFAFIKGKIERFLSENAKAFRAREDEGMIRYCHGDLHSGNVFISDDKIHIFDRIEFNLRFACSDTAADLAFMTMDLDYHNNRGLSDFLLDRYLEYTGDWGMLRFHDFFRCYRAYVRGKVTGFMLSQNPSRPEEIKDKARSYFDLAGIYASTLFDKPKLMVFYGLPGTGKSFISARTRDFTNAVHLRSDLLRRGLAGVTYNQHHYADFGQELYSRGVSEKVYEGLRERSVRYLSQGQSVILDATYGKAERRRRLAETMGKLGIDTYFIRCQAPDDVVRERIESRDRKDPLSDATWDIYQKMKEGFEPEEHIDFSILQTDSRAESLETIVSKIINPSE